MKREGPLPIKAETWELIQRLVGFDTTSRDSNLGLIEWVRDWLAHQGVRSRLTYDPDGAKANLFATIEKGAHPGIVLSGHTDVVPVDGQPWDTDPFAATLKDGRIYGRGSADMKSYIACALALTPRLLAADLRSPVHFALSYDEEVGCMGVRGLLADLDRAGIAPAGCIIGEPTLMQPVVAHKGKRAYRCCFRGREAHSALTPEGVNAVEYAARLVVHIRHMAERLRDCERRDHGFDVIRGGTAGNIVPRDFEVHFEFRYLPGVDPEAIEREIKDYAERVLLPEMRAVDPATYISFETSAEIPGLDPTVARAEQERMTALARALARSDATSKVAYATEAGLFQRAGIPSIICGPGSIGEAHKPNEFITLEQVALCEAFMDRLLESLAT